MLAIQAKVPTLFNRNQAVHVSVLQKEKEQLAHAQHSYDDAEPWHLPIGHRPQDSLDTEGLAMASTDTAIPEDNRGYRMLQRMGWKGTGLGRNENGESCPIHQSVLLS